MALGNDFYSLLTNATPYLPFEKWTPVTKYNPNWTKNAGFNFNLSLVDSYNIPVIKFNNDFKLTPITTPTITKVNLNFDKLKVSMENIGKLLDTKVGNIVIPKTDVEITKLGGLLSGMKTETMKIQSVAQKITDETNNTIRNVNTILNNDLINAVQTEIKNAGYASVLALNTLEKIPTTEKTMELNKPIVMEAIDTNKAIGEQSVAKLQETALNINTNIKLKASDAMVEAITKSIKMNNPADQILLKNIVDAKLNIAIDAKDALTFSKTTYELMNMRTDDAGILIKKLAGDLIQPNTTGIKKNFVMVYDMKKMDAGMIQYLTKERFISGVEENTKLVLSDKEVNGKTVFQALTEYKKQNPTSIVQTPVLSTALLGPEGEGIKEQEQKQNKEITYMQFKTQTPPQTAKTPTVPTPSTAGNYIVKLTTPNNKTTELKYNTLEEAKQQMAIYKEQNPESTRTLKQIVPEKNAVKSTVTLTRYNEKGERIVDDITISTTGTTIAETNKDLQKQIDERMKTDTKKGLTFGEYEIKNYESNKQKEITIESIGGLETKTHAPTVEVTQQKVMKWGTGEIQKAGEIAPGVLEKTKQLELVNNVNVVAAEPAESSSLQPSQFIKVLKPGETTKTTGLVEQLRKEKQAEQPTAYKDESITVVRLDVDPQNKLNIEGAPDVVNQWLGKIQDWYQPDNENLATKGVLEKTAIVTTGAKMMDVYGSQTKQLNAATALTEMYGPIHTETEFKLTPKGEEIREQVIKTKMSGALKLSDIDNLDENDQNNLVYELAFAKTPEAMEKMKIDIKNLPNTVLVRDMNTWYGDTIRDVLGEQKLEIAYKDPEVVKNYGKLFEGQTLEKITKVASEITSPWITGDPITDFSVFFLTGGIAGETEVMGKLSTKAATKILDKIAGISGDIEQVSKFWKYTKEAGIEIPTSVYNADIGDIVGSTLIGKTKVGATSIVQVPTMIRMGADAVNPDIATRAMNVIGKETKFDSAITANLLNEQIGTISKATQVSPAMITTRADIRNMVTNSAIASTRPEFENSVMKKLETIWENEERAKIEPTIKVSTDTSKPTRISYGMLPSVKAPNVDDVKMLKDAALDGDTSLKTIRIPTGDYANKLKNYVKTNDIYKIQNVGYVKIESVGQDSIKARIATGEEVTSAAKKFTWDYMNEDVLGNTLKDKIDGKIATLHDEMNVVGTPAAKVENIRKQIKDLETYISEDTSKLGADFTKPGELDPDINVVDIPEKISMGTTEWPVKELEQWSVDKLNDELLKIDKMKETGQKLSITEKELLDLPINQETKNAILSQYSHLLRKEETMAKTIEKALPEMTIGVETPLKGLGLNAVSLPRVVGKAEDIAKMGDRLEAIILESADFAKLQKEAPEGADIIKKAFGYGDTGDKEIAKLVTESDAWKAMDPKVREWTIATVDAKLVKSTGLPSEWTIENALSDARKLDYTKAAEKLKTIDPNSAKKLREMREQTKDIPLRQIGELEAHGVPKKVVQELKSARKEEALLELDRKGLSEQVAKLRDGRALNSEEIDAMWKERDLVQDALYKSDNELKMKTRIFEEKAKEINARAEELMMRGTKEEKAALAEERKAFRKAIDDETAKCKKEAPLTGGCAPGGAVSSGGKSVGKGAAIIGASALVGGAILSTTETADGKKWLYDKKSNTYMEITPIGPKTISPSYSLRQSEIGEENVATSILPAYDKLMKSDIPKKQYKTGVYGTLDDNEQICQDYALQAANMINSDENLKNKGLQAKIVTILGTVTEAPNGGEYKPGDMIAHAAILIENTKKPIGSYVDPTSGKTVTMYEQTLMEPQTGQTGETGSDLTGTSMMLGNYKYKIESTQEMKTGEQQLVYEFDLARKTAITVPTSQAISTTIEGNAQAMNKNVETVKGMGANESVINIAKVDPYWTFGGETKIKPALPSMNIGE